MCPEEEHVGPFATHGGLIAALGPTHPYNGRVWATLHWYDGPIYSVMRVRGDERPRLDILVDSHHEGGEADRVFNSVNHHLVFDRIETLQATLHEGVATEESYRLAEYIIRYRTRMTRINHPDPSHEVWTSRHTAETIPERERPDPHVPDGLVVPGVEPIAKDKPR